jgi:hypothetical protein
MVRKLALIISLISYLAISGCIERKLTITTEPSGALVLLNDEEIGTSPVTVGFEWYGDYNVRLSKQNFQTLVTHRKLAQPMRDKFPLDLFDDMFKTRIDEYSWNFKLEPLVQPTKEELIEKAMNLRKEALVDPNAIAPKGIKPAKPKTAKPKADKKKTETKPK